MKSPNNDSTGSPVNDFQEVVMDHKRSRYPYCIVWTPIPILTWIFPFIGHMGIAISSGIIHDFAGPYIVSEDDMAFGKPTKYWKLDPDKAREGKSLWDSAIAESTEVYSHKNHNLCFDNCHSHVALALNLMQYDGSNSWNMVKLCFYTVLYGRYVSWGAVLKTWLPFLVFVSGITLCVLYMEYS